MKKFAEYAEEREAILENDEHHAWVGKHIENSKLTHGAMKKKFVKKFGKQHTASFDKHVAMHVD